MDFPWPTKPEAGIGTIEALVPRIQQVRALLEPEAANVTTHIQAEYPQACHLPLPSDSLQALQSALAPKPHQIRHALCQMGEKLDTQVTHTSVPPLSQQFSCQLCTCSSAKSRWLQSSLLRSSQPEGFLG